MSYCLHLLVLHEFLLFACLSLAWYFGRVWWLPLQHLGSFCTSCCVCLYHICRFMSGAQSSSSSNEESGWELFSWGIGQMTCFCGTGIWSSCLQCATAIWSISTARVASPPVYWSPLACMSIWLSSAAFAASWLLIARSLYLWGLLLIERHPIIVFTYRGVWVERCSVVMHLILHLQFWHLTSTKNRGSSRDGYLLISCRWSWEM